MPTEEQTSITGIFSNVDANNLYGQRLTISNRVVTKLSMPLSDNGGTGNVVFGIRRVSDNSLIALKTGIAVSSIVNYPAYEWVEVTFDTPVLINEEVRIFVRTSSSTVTGCIVYQLDADTKAGEYQTRYSLSLPWIDKTTREAPYIYTYTLPIVSPTVTTDPATSVESAAATLNGTLADDGGEACDCGFEWGETSGYGNTTPTQSRTIGQTFAQTITGLDPGKTYHFRAIATNSAGTSYGTDRTFTTLMAAPTVTTDPASAVGQTTATLNGTLDGDGGEACDCGFEYGETTDYGTETATESKETGETFSQVITELSRNTLYHFRTIATNAGGTGNGSDATFTTF